MKNQILLTFIGLLFSFLFNNAGSFEKALKYEKKKSLKQLSMSKINGTVVTKDTKEPVPFANVSLEKEGIFVSGTMSDFDGNFVFENLDNGIYSLIIKYIGFVSKKIDDIELKANAMEYIKIELYPCAELLEVVEIRSYAIPLISYDRVSSGGTFTAEEMKRMPARSASSKSQTVAGVYSSNGSMGTVRGARSEGTAIYIDGIKINPSASKTNNNNHNSIGVADKNACSLSLIETPSNVVQEKSKPSLQEENALKSLITATEINDFSKWELWKDLKDNVLNACKDIWRIAPQNRYAVQVLGDDDRPVIDALVILKDKNGNVQWTSKTDNTGKAELWLNMFNDKKIKSPELCVLYGSETYCNLSPKLFSKGINVFRIPAACYVPNHIDIAFVVDATASMSDEIAFLKSDIIDIISSTEDAFAGADINVGSVFYRCFRNSYVTRMLQMGTDKNEVALFINSLSAGEGGDEAVEEALRVAIDSLNWSTSARARLLFLVLDEQPLTDKDVLKTMHHYIENAASRGIRIIPVVGSAESINHALTLEYLMRSIALATNGTYIALTDHSGIGSQHAAPVTDTYEVELLNNLIKRIIFQYCYVPNCEQITFEELIADTTTFSNSEVLFVEINENINAPEEKSPDLIISDFTVPYENDTLNQDQITKNEEILTPDNSLVNAGNLKEISFYPNPTNGKITVNISGKIEALYLYDISGKLLAQYPINREKQRIIDLSNYSTGVYILKFFDNGKAYDAKVLLMR